MLVTLVLDFIYSDTFIVAAQSPVSIPTYFLARLHYKKAVLFLLLQFIFVASADAQIVHLTPISFNSYHSDSVLLKIERNPPAAGAGTTSALANSNVVFRIYDGKYYISIPNNIDQEDLGDRTIGEFIQYLHGRFTDVTFSSSYPEASVSELAEGNYSYAGNTITIKPGMRRPTIDAALAVGFIANEVRASGTQSNTLMRNAGLDLDLVATKPFKWYTLRARVGFHSSEPVPVEEEPEAVPVGAPSEELGTAQQVETPETPTDPRTLIQGAEAIGIGLEFAVHVPLGLEQVHLTASLDGSQYWTSPDAFVFPAFVGVNGEPKPFGDYFDEDDIALARDGLDRIVPLRTLLGGARMLFGRRDGYTFYVLMDVGTRQYLSRGLTISYRVDRTVDPVVTTPIRLTPRFETGRETISRLGLGVRLSSAVDFKVDVVTPIEDRERGGRAQPTLRIHLATPGVKFGR